MVDMASFFVEKRFCLCTARQVGHAISRHLAHHIDSFCICCNFETQEAEQRWCDKYNRGERAELLASYFDSRKHYLCRAHMI